MTVATASTRLAASRGRVGAAFMRAARTLVASAVSIARRGGATAIGAAGLASIAIGAGDKWGLAVGLMVGGVLAVWFASLVPDGGRR